MQYELAPMEGITTYVFRQAIQHHFSGFDRYYTPFLSPTYHHTFKNKELSEILPEHNQGICVVPQLLTKNSEDFLWAVDELTVLGYREVNLNLGCPSSTVVSKKKGAGQLADPAALTAFLDEIFAASPLSISIKTRLGMEDPAEFSRLIPIFCSYPLARLIIHPRVRTDYYDKPVHLQTFLDALPEFPFPVIYNGDLRTVRDIEELSDQAEGLAGVMLGRGALANPGIAREAKGHAPMTKEELRAFFHALLDGYKKQIPYENFVLCKLKEYFDYPLENFADSDQYKKRLRRIKRLSEFMLEADRILEEGEWLL